MGEELMRKVWSICADRYGAALPDVIFNRLQQELQNITVYRGSVPAVLAGFHH